MSSSLLNQLATVGSDVTLWYAAESKTPGVPGQVHSGKMKLFYKTGNPQLYGRAGTLYWAPQTPTGIVTIDETNTARRFALSTVSDIKCFRQSAVFRSPACAAIQQELCFSMANDMWELNLQFNSAVERELWWKVILSQLESTGRKLLQDSPPAAAAAVSPTAASASPTAVPASATSPSSQTQQPQQQAAAAGSKDSKKLSLTQSPEELRQILSRGSPFRKYDLDATGKLIVREVVCFTSGVDRSGVIHWVDAGEPLVPVPGIGLQLGKITDILMRKKSPAFKSQDPQAVNAKEEVCFALVTDSYTLSLEARTKEQRTHWQDGLVAMLTSAGKQLLRKTSTPASVTGNHPRSNSEGVDNAGAIAAVAASPGATRRSNSSVDQGLNSSAVNNGTDVQSLQVGSNFYMYYINPANNTLVKQWCHVWFHMIDNPSNADAPGFLYFSTKPNGDRTMYLSQRFPLNQITELSGGHKAAAGAVFKHAPVQPVADLCATITGKEIAWNLELIPGAGNEHRGKELRDSFLKNIVSVIGRFRASAGAAASGGAPVHRGSVISPSAAAAAAAGAPSDDVRMLRDGQNFLRHTLNARGELESKPILLWFDDSAASPAPGVLYFAPINNKEKNPNEAEGKLLLNHLQTMAAGKESTLFKQIQNINIKILAAEKCMSISGGGMTLDLEAPTFELREKWIRALHEVMVRHGKKAKIDAAAAANANSPTPASPGQHRSSISQGGSPSPAPANATSPSPVTAVVVTPIPTTDEHINTLQNGINVTVFYTTPKNDVLCAEIQLFLVVPPISGVDMAAVSSSNPLYADQLDVVSSNLHWCAATSQVKKVVEGQKLSLASVREMKEGKESALLKSEIARNYPANCCFQIMGASLTLNLSAQTEQSKEKFMIALDSLMRKIKDKQKAIARSRAASSSNGLEGQTPVSQLRRSVSEEGQPSPPAEESKQQYATMVVQNVSSVEGVTRPSSMSAASPSPSPASATSSSSILSPHPNPLSPNSPASPPSASIKAVLPAMDHKSSVALLSTGQTFTYYSFHSDVAKSILNQEQKQDIFVFFVATNGQDSPGTLHWVPYVNGSPVARVQNDKSRTFYLNQMKQMCAGKETAILRSTIATNASVNNCLSLFSINCAWNLEAPSIHVRDTWMKSLHQVLLRHGMKAVDKPADASSSSAAAPASSASATTANATTDSARSSPTSNVSASGSSSAALSQATRALPARDSSSNASMNNRTINFSDPTDLFLLQSKIGEGSYGAVYKALNFATNKSVAIKVLQFQGRDSLKLRKEIHILRQCHSDYIVGYKGAFQKGGNLWIVLEYCSAGSLSDIMQICNRTFSEAQVACIMRDSLKGLAYLHAQKKIHRDIKGGNILVDEDGVSKLADFGVSSNLDKALGKNRTVIGTPHWMAPEVLMNDDYNEKADIWSLGITAYELAIGEPPHSKLHSMRAAIKIPTSPPPTLPEPQRFSDDFHDFMRRALIKDFHVRPSAEELLQCPFIQKAPGREILMENVRAAMTELESKHESIDEIQGLMFGTASGSKKGNANAGTGRNTGKQSMRGVSSTRESGSQISDSADADFDDDFDNEDFSSSTMRANNSDTMLVGGNDINGTMIQAGGNNATRPLPASNINSDTVAFGATMLMTDAGSANSLTASTVDAVANSPVAFHPPSAASASASSSSAAAASSSSSSSAAASAAVSSAGASDPSLLAQNQTMMLNHDEDDGDDALDQFDDDDEDEEGHTQQFHEDVSPPVAELRITEEEESS